MKGGTKMNYDFKLHTLPNYSKDNYVAYWVKLLKKLDYRLGYIANDNVGYNPMSITDMADYLGFSLDEKISDECFWLLGMRERANILKGDLRVQSEPGAGTQLFLKIPLEETDELE